MQLLGQLLEAMGGIGTPLLSARGGYGGPARFLPALDAIHRRLGRRRKTLRKKGLVGAVFAGQAPLGSTTGGCSPDNAAAAPMQGREPQLCSVCGTGFQTRNQLFRHLRVCNLSATTATADDDTAAAAAAAAAAAPADPPQAAPPPKKQPPLPKKKKVRTDRKNPPLSAAATTLWFGDIPAELATARQVGQLLWSAKPRSMPMPFVRHATRKGYRGDARAQSAPVEEAGGRGDIAAALGASGSSKRGAKAPWVGYAFVVFRDAAEAAEATAHFNGRTVGGSWRIRVRPHEESKSKGAANAAEAVKAAKAPPPPLGAGADPPLGHQLFPPSLRPHERLLAVRRHCEATGIAVPPSVAQQTAAEAEAGAAGGAADGPADAAAQEREAMAAIKAHYRAHPRTERRARGAPLPPPLLARLRGTLDALRWPPIHSRPGMQTSHYHVVRLGAAGLGAASAAQQQQQQQQQQEQQSDDGSEDALEQGRDLGQDGQKDERPQGGVQQLFLRNDGFEELASLCRDVLAFVDPTYPCSLVAVTKNFQGSPHVDHSDVSFQYALSLGDFGGGGGGGGGVGGGGGGELCVEDAARADALWVVETRDRVAKVDGRFIHWVRGYGGGGVRYSLIFFATDPARGTPPAEAAFPEFLPAGAARAAEQLAVAYAYA